MNSVLLRVEHLSLQTRRTQRTLIQDVSFQLMGGECLALVGPPESGKTLLLKLLNRLIEPSSGQIYLQDQQVYPPTQSGNRSLSITQLRQSVMLVMATSPLFGQTPRAALLYPLTLQRLAPGVQQERFQHCLEQFQIPEKWLDIPESLLSESQRRWIGLARAWITQPQVLLLDCPLQGLTTAQATDLAEILSKFSQDLHRSVICVDAHWDWIAQVSTKAIYLAQGRVATEQMAPNIDWPNFQAEIQRQATLEAEDWD